MSKLKVLITAGPTWIKVDRVRILTSIFTGDTGVYLSRYLSKRGSKVTLVLNTHKVSHVEGVTVVPFRYFEELDSTIKGLLSKNNYDVIIHSAAVSDYRVKKPFEGKIASKKKNLILKLTPTQKIITMMRSSAKKSVLVQFKLEAQRRGLLQKAFASLERNKSDYVVANALSDLAGKYKAFLVDAKGSVKELHSRQKLAASLCKIVFLRKKK